jgi:hypothetical protein
MVKRECHDKSVGAMLHAFFSRIYCWIKSYIEVHCMSIEGEVGRSTHKLRVHIRLIYRFPFIRLSGSWLPTQ